MKICEFTEHDLRATSPAPGVFKNRYRGFTPMERSIHVLSAALKTVNQAGLEGRELSDITVVYSQEAAKHPDDMRIEIHAKVKHRLAVRPAPESSATKGGAL